jgi:hypothetical protein
VRRHGNLVLGVCRRVLGNHHDAEDAFQATFLLLAKKASAIDWQDCVAGWLHRTAQQLACNVRTAAEGYGPGWVKVAGPKQARDAREVTCNLTLDPGKTIKGTIVDPDGKPITGVRVRGTWGYPSSPQQPLATPHFTLPAVDLSRAQPFFFWHHEKKLGAVALFKGDRTEGITVKLKRLGVITGRLLDLDGVPLAGHLTGYVEDGQLGIKRGWAGFFWAGVNKDGRFRAEVIPGVAVGAYCSVGPARLGEKVFQKLTLEPGQKHDVGDVKVNPRGD